MLRFYYCLEYMDKNKLTKNYGSMIKTWSSEIKQKLSRKNLLLSIDRILPKSCLQMLHELLLKNILKCLDRNV